MDGDSRRARSAEEPYERARQLIGHHECVDEAEVLLTQALESRDPAVAAGAALELGGILVQQSGRQADAAAAWRVAAASENPIYAARGGYNLGRLLASQGLLGDAEGV